jgi:S1-C subfamily serine protease
MSSVLARHALRALRDGFTDLVEDVAPSVVTVRNTDVSSAGGSGSGWAIAPDLIVTNAHVVAGMAPSFRLRLRGGDLLPAELVGSDPMTDLAVLRAHIDLRPLSLRASTVRLGEPCLAFGSPLGDYPESVTHGVVSGLDRRLPGENGRTIEHVLQTDAEINPGNSGGPLVDVEGEVIGVNAAIRVDGRGLGFAIPAETVRSIVPELVEYGRVVRPKLGVGVEVFEHRDQGRSRERLRVASAESGCPLRQGDVLLALDQTPLATRADLFGLLRRPLAGRTVPVEVEREGRTMTVQMKMGT